MKISACIIGGGGYVAGELIRLLLDHPKVSLDQVYSRSQAGKPLYSVHTDLLGITEMEFATRPLLEVDVLFLCLGHGHAHEFLATHTIPETTKIIDLSRDFRLATAGNDFVYGLPELNRSQIKESTRVANCGCFATAIQLALLPLAKAGILKQDVHVQAVTGATGAGAQPSSTTHFSWRLNNLSVYKPFQHQHIPEIRQSLEQLQNTDVAPIHFLPVRGDFSRGIFATVYTELEESGEALTELYQTYYRSEPFVWYSPTTPTLKSVVNTNKCVVYGEKIGKQWLVISVLDNLLKGASGQAVQNMNILFGWEETLGLKLKAVVF